MDTVRVLAGLSGILRDQANPAASWSLLGEILPGPLALYVKELTAMAGMAIRSAQSIGLHCVPEPTNDSCVQDQLAWRLW